MDEDMWATPATMGATSTRFPDIEAAAAMVAAATKAGGTARR
jgi:hypothetical protein